MNQGRDYLPWVILGLGLLWWWHRRRRRGASLNRGEAGSRGQGLRVVRVPALAGDKANAPELDATSTAV